VNAHSQIHLGVSGCLRDTSIFCVGGSGVFSCWTRHHQAPKLTAGEDSARFHFHQLQSTPSPARYTTYVLFVISATAISHQKQLNIPPPTADASSSDDEDDEGDDEYQLNADEFLEAVAESE
jgi:hypothetical protein